MATEDSLGNLRSADNLFMDGVEIFNFTLRSVPVSLERLLEKAGLGVKDVDLFVFHQTNKYMLDHLRKRMGLPEEKFFIAMSHCGNTVSCSIPIALKHAMTESRITAGDLVALAGWGVGYSWGATLVRWV